MRTIPIRQQIIPWGNYNRPKYTLNSGGLYILVHDTGNTRPGADAEMHADFVYGGGGASSVSFHFAVDEKGAWQILPLDEGGWHASDGCDNRATDWGCFQSIAIETCIHDNNRHKDTTRKNLITLIAMIINGHPSILFGKSDYKRFSADRIRSHQQAANNNKYCPATMLRDGYYNLIPNLVRKELSSDPAQPSMGTTFTTRYEIPIRQAPGFNPPILKTLPVGTTGTIISGPKPADGIDWYDVGIKDFGTGWIPASILKTLAIVKG